MNKVLVGNKTRATGHYRAVKWIHRGAPDTGRALQRHKGPLPLRAQGKNPGFIGG